MKMKFLLHEKNVWELFMKDIATKYWAWKNCSSRNTHEHCMFMKKDKLAHGTILFNVIASCSTCKKCKESLGQPLLTFEKWHVEKLKMSKYLQSYDGRRHFNASSHWQATHDCYLISNHWSLNFLLRFLHFYGAY